MRKSTGLVRKAQQDLRSSAAGRRDDHGFRRITVGAPVWVVLMSPQEAGHPIVDLRSIRLKDGSAAVGIFNALYTPQCNFLTALLKVQRRRCVSRVGLVASFDNV